MDTLAQVDFIAAEDTRVTVKLLNHLGLKKPMVSYHRHSGQGRSDELVARLLGGEDCALVTDAGTPAISDPGEELVAQCAQQGIPVVAIPGACAFVNALAVSGLPTGRFTFEGFLPMNKKNRRAHLESLQGEARTMLFHEAPHKLFGHLKRPGGDLRTGPAGGPVPGAHQAPRGGAADHPGQGWWPTTRRTRPRGSSSWWWEGAAPQREEPPTLEEGLALVNRLRGRGWSTRDAVKEAASRCGLPRKALYDLAVANQPAP